MIIAVTAALLVVAIALGASALVRRSGADPRTVAGRQAPNELSVGVTELDEVRARVAFPSSLAWTGDELSMIGHSTAKADGATLAAASYDPASGSWREWPAWPYEQPVFNAQVVWVGERAVVVGVGCDAHPDEESLNCTSTRIVAAVFDHAAFSWARVEAPVTVSSLNEEEQAMGVCCIAMGRAGGEADFIIGGSVFGFQLDTQAWLPRPSVPDGVATTQFCEFDDGIVAFARSQPSDVDPVRRLQPVMLGSASWVPLAAQSVTDTTAYLGGVGVVCSPERLVAVAADWQHAWELAGRAAAWTPIPPPDVNLEDPISSTVTTVLPPPELPPRLESWEWTGSAFVWWTGKRSTSLTALDGSGRTATLTHEGLGVAYGPATQHWVNVVPGPKVLGAAPNQVAWRDDVGYAVVASGHRLMLVAYRPG